MKKFWISTAIVVALGVSLAAAEGMRHHRGHGFLSGRMAQALNLTADQQAQIKSLMQAEKPKMQPLMGQLRSDEQQIREATQATPFDEAKVSALAANEAQARAQITVERARMQSQIYRLLTPEQRTKAESMHQQFKQHMRRKKPEASSTTPQQ
jgi:protein CpxP